MEELLFRLTPAEWWVWNYLVYLAKKQGSPHIILPRPGEDPQAEKVFSRKHLKRLIKSLRAKLQITHLVFPRSKNRQIEVLLAASKIGDLGVPNNRKGFLEVPNKEPLGTRESPKATLGTYGSRIMEVITTALPSSAPSQAKLKECLKTLLELKQGDLKGEVARLTEGEIYQMIVAMRQLLRYEPKGKKLSDRARLYAMVRMVQTGEAIERPQAWVDQVAKAAEREIREGRWSGAAGQNSAAGPGLSRIGHM